MLIITFLNYCAHGINEERLLRSNSIYSSASSDSSASRTSSSDFDESDYYLLNHEDKYRGTKIALSQDLAPKIPSVNGSHIMSAYLDDSLQVQPNLEVSLGQDFFDQILNVDMIHVLFDQMTGIPLPIDNITQYLGSPQFFGHFTDNFQALSWLGMYNLTVSNISVIAARLAPVDSQPNRIVTLMDDRIRISVTNVAVKLFLNYKFTGPFMKREIAPSEMWVRIMDSSLTVDIVPVIDKKQRAPVFRLFDHKSVDMKIGKLDVEFRNSQSNSFHIVMAQFLSSMFKRYVTKRTVESSLRNFPELSGRLYLKSYGLLMSMVNEMFESWNVPPPRLPELVALNFGWKLEDRRFVIFTRLIAIKRNGRDILEGAIDELNSFSEGLQTLSNKDRKRAIKNLNKILKNSSQ